MRQRAGGGAAQGRNAAEIDALLSGRTETTARTGGSSRSAAFVAFTLGMGLGNIPFNQEIIFAGSFGIIGFLLVRLTELEPTCAPPCSAR